MSDRGGAAPPARRLAVVTGSRAEYGLLLWTLRALAAAPDFELRLVVTGAHLDAAHGATGSELEADGFTPAERVPILGAASGGAFEGGAAVDAAGEAVRGLGAALRRQAPELLLVLGDRYEVLAAAFAATLLGIGIAHVDGGELSTGAVDDAFRHALTKLAHLHLVSTEPYARRVAQLGEEPWRIRVVGAAAVENLLRLRPMPREELARDLGLDLRLPTLLLTYHPETRDAAATAGVRARALLDAVARCGAQVVLTAPCADPGRDAIDAELRRFAAGRPGAVYRASLGRERYLSLLRHVAAVVGNSSSGLIEAPVVGVPTVNVGGRQEGRLRSASVIDVGPDAREIEEGLRRALDPAWRAGLLDAAGQPRPHPFGDGRTSEHIVEALRTAPRGDALLRKRFIDVPR
ncbi:MAG: UDP-N-acetylglucosamine 2-epimerase (hydrolyzing) [Planctomycetes bacterium]|nr:UDP-N-acetylglucosamine 2-epimerase (hydrolyzing) [Planctomycetota bacterium]